MFLFNVFCCEWAWDLPLLLFTVHLLASPKQLGGRKRAGARGLPLMVLLPFRKKERKLKSTGV